MSSEVTRRAFLFGVIGAAAAGWVWMRDRGLTVDSATGSTATAPPTPTTTTVPPTIATAAPTTSAPVATTSSTTSTTLTPVHIEALCRDSWGAAAVSGTFKDHTIERMTVHHTARPLRRNSDTPRAIRIHQNFHQSDRGWPDIAYHFIIDLEGNVYECRPTSAVGDTGTNYDPTGHFLVCCEGDFNQQDLPEAQRDALVDMLAWASTEFGVAPKTIAGHRDVAATSCPGDGLYSIIESGELVEAVKQRKANGGVEMAIVCGDVAFDRVRAIENA